MVGLLVGLAIPISKSRASASYILISLGLSALIFLGFHALSVNGRGLRLPFLSAWGRNPLLLYVLHGVLLGFFALPPIPGWYVDAPLWLIPLQAAAIVLVLSWIALWFDRRQWYITL